MSKGTVNKAIIIGSLGQDPEVRYMSNGDAWATISVATAESWKDKNTGEQQEHTEWHRVVFYRRQAEVVGQYLKKGSKVYIEGRLQTRQWEKDGVKHYTTEIIANDMKMLNRVEPSADGGQSRPVPSAAPSKPSRPPARQPQTGGSDGFDDDIPF